MDKEVDKKLDRLTGKLLKDFSRETPSFDFTTKVMSRVDGLSTSKVYEPLLSKKTWMILIVFVVGILAYAIFGNIQLENSWATFFKAESLPKLGLLDFKMSNVLVYSIVGFTFFTVIQIFILIHQFNKRFALY